MSTAILFAALAAIGVGVSDFLIGIAGRRDQRSTGLLPIFVVSMLAALPAAIMLEGAPRPDQLFWGAIVGLSWAISVQAVARGVAEGRVVVVVPLSGFIAAALPVMVGVLFGERPATLAWAGIALGVVAVALTGLGDHGGGGRTVRWSVAMGTIIGVTTGANLVFLSRTDGIWPLFVAATVALGSLTASYLVRGTKLALPARGAMLPSVGAGICTIVGFWFTIEALSMGQLGTVSVVASQYPAATVLLAAVIWRQRPVGIQYLGITLALTAVGLISAATA